MSRKAELDRAAASAKAPASAGCREQVCTTRHPSGPRRSGRYTSTERTPARPATGLVMTAGSGRVSRSLNNLRLITFAADRPGATYAPGTARAMPTLLHISDLHRTAGPRIDNDQLLAAIASDASRWATEGIRRQARATAHGRPPARCTLRPERLRPSERGLGRQARESAARSSRVPHHPELPAGYGRARPRLDRHDGLVGRTDPQSGKRGVRRRQGRGGDAHAAPRARGRA